MKSHELARELGISQKELVNFLQQRRLTRNAAAPLPPGAVEAARSAFKPTSVAVKIEANGDRRVVLPPTLSVKELAEKLGVGPVEVIKKLMASKILATINQVIDFATAEIVADEFGFTVEPVLSEDVVAVEAAEGDGAVVTTSREELFSLANEDPSKLVPRAPIVTVMGHVDHGKTSILDAIRKTRVAAGEAGGITQRIGAYKIETADGHPVVFIDTPGHEAFTAMRARGAQVTDLVVLVVAADDGVKPQTVEAIQHARAAKVPIIVAINKIDKADAKPERVRTDLLQHEIQVESMGGDVVDVEVSATKKTNLDKLLEAIHLQSEILDLKADPSRAAEGTVIEAKLDRGRGPVATVLVQRGTLRPGDIVVAGAEWGRVRALISDAGANVDAAGPSVPVEVLGFNGTPEAGDRLAVVDSEARAREVTDYRQRQRRETAAVRAGVVRGSLEQMMSQLKTAAG